VWVCLLLVASSAAACGRADGGFGVAPVSEGTADHRYVIPAGTGAAIDRGGAVDLVPAELKVRVGQIIELVNEDERGHLVGPFFVGSEETIRHRFTSPGVYEGECGVHSGGRMVVTVVP
jgi:plastocyanin